MLRLLVPLLVALGLLLSSAPADAAVTNVLATNELGEPLDEGITTIDVSENLWAYVTAVTPGIICVHPYPADEASTCDDAGVWAEGAAPPFFAGFIPIAPPMLQPGVYQLVAVSGLAAFSTPKAEAVSQPFRITTCEGDGCPPPVPADPTAAKRVFKAVYDSMYTTCQLTKALSLVKRAEEAKGVYDEWITAGSSPAGAFGFATVSVAVKVGQSATYKSVIPKSPPYLPSSIGLGIWTMCKAFFGTKFPSSPLPFLSGPNLSVPGPLHNMTRWMQDPPQPYEEIAQPDFLDFAQVEPEVSAEPDKALALPRSIDRLRGYLDAGTTSWERFQGAQADSADTYARRQAYATSRDFGGLRTAIGQASRQIDAIRDAFGADGTIPESLTQDEIDLAGAYMQRVRDDGFTDAELTDLHDAGLSETAVAELRDAVGGDPTVLTPDLTFTGALSDLSAALRDARADLDAFANANAAYAGAGNHAPQAGFTTAKDPANPLGFTFTDASTDPDGDPLDVHWDFGDGETGVGETVQHTYTAAGHYTVTETVSDFLSSDATSRTIGAGPNLSPHASDDTLTTAEEAPATVDVLANDTDPDGDSLTASVATGPEHASASCAPDGTCTVSPLDGFHGHDSFTYTLDDGNGGTATGTVQITVTEVNDPPGAGQDAVELSLGQADALADVLANDSTGDPDDAQTLELTDITAAPEHGTAAIEPGGIRYTPAPGFGGHDRLRYQVCDDGITAGAPDPQCSEGLLSIWVHGHPPVGVDDTASTDEDTPVDVNVLANDTDEDGDALTWAGTSPPGHGTVNCYAGGVCTYTPDADYNGPDSFGYDVLDSTGEYGHGAVTVTVAAVNDDPVARADHFATPTGTPGSLDVLANDRDVDGDHVTVSDADDGAHGAVSCTAGGRCTYSPAAGYTGPDAFHYTAVDGHGGSAQGTVHVVDMLGAQPADVPDSKGRDFWLTFGQNLGQPTLSLFLTGDTSTTGVARSPAVALNAPFGVNQGDVTTIDVPAEAALGSLAPGGTVFPDAAIHVSAEHEITAYGLNRVEYTTDAYLGLPTDVLGTEYVLMGWGNGGFSWNAQEIDVVGTQDGTQVRIDRPDAAPVDVTLGGGDVWALNVPDADADVTGTVVTASKPVAVFSGNQCANIPTDIGFCDHVVEEMPPTSTWGARFVTTPLATRTKGDVIRILAARDGTTVKIDGAVAAHLDRGEFVAKVLDRAASIEADGPVLVAQFAQGSEFDDCPAQRCDPFMMLIPPYEQYLASYTLTTPATGYEDNYVNVAVRSTGTGALRMDGEAIPAASFKAVTGSGFSYAQIPVETGSHVFEGAVPFGAYAYGWSQFDSYGYPGGLSLAPVADVTHLTLTPATATRTVGTRHCATATATGDPGAALSGLRIDFEVKGTHPATGFATTGAAGTADFCWTGSRVGTDTVDARLGSLAAHATVAWAKPTPPPTPTPTPSPTPTPAPGPPPLPPAPKLADVVQLPSTKRCVSRRKFRIRLRQPRGERIVKATVIVAGKRVKVFKGTRLTTNVDLRGLPAGRFAVKITLVTDKGRTIRGTRRYRTCATTRGHAKRHKV